MEKGGLSIRLLGEVGLGRGGAPVALPASKKTRALLGYLVATRTAQPRQRLCDLLWDGPDDPRAALRWSLTKLRPLVDDDGARRLVGDRDHIAFEPAGAAVDLFEASAHVGRDVTSSSTAALSRAAAALSGDFLEGLDMPDCYRFHEWCTGERERVRALRLAVLDVLVERLTDGSPEEALRHARQRLAIDPLADTAHATAVRLLARLGRNAEAQAQVETCRRILERELGGRRSPALEVARLDIGKTAPAETGLPRTRAASESARPRAPIGRADPTFVARDAERVALDDLVHRATDGRADDVVLLSGEPGIGKSRLLGELTALTQAVGGTVLAARAFEAESMRPFGVWIDLLRGASLTDLDAATRQHLAPLFPELGEAPGDAESKARLFDAVARLLRGLSARTPVVVVVDDLHWLDEASAGLLHYVARVSAGTRIAIVCATRDGELEDNEAALRLVRALRREGHLTTLSLAPLGAEDTAALVRAAAGADVDPERVFLESGGNPLFAIEVARALSGGEREGPQPLDCLLEERLLRVTPRARDLVVWAAALGREFDPDVLAAAAGESLGQTVGAIGDLERDGLVVSSRAGYAFTHELVRKAAYRQLTGARRRLVHLGIARALAASPDPGATWGDVVHHATLADDAALVAQACVAAGHRALRMLARRQARDFATRGLAQAKRLGLDGLAVRGELLKIAGLSSTLEGERRLALEADAEEVVRLANEGGRPEVAALALFALAFFRSVRGDLEGAHQVTLGAEEASRAGSPLARVETLANTAFCLAIIEREHPKARALLDEAAESARALRVSVVDVDLGEGYLAHTAGDVAGARRALERGLELARVRADAWRQSMALVRLAMIELESGAWEATRARARELQAVAAQLGEGSEGAIADSFDALARAGAGEAEGSEGLTAAVAALVRADATSMLAYTLTTAAEMATDGGAFAEAAELGRRALDAAVPLGKPSAMILAHAAIGRASLGAGDRASAVSQLEAGRGLVDHAYGVSKRAREGLDRLAELSNGGTNAAAHAPAARKRKR
ncbi:MAG: AAA family ATPase [Polyangiaceae bacterium]